MRKLNIFTYFFYNVRNFDSQIIKTQLLCIIKKKSLHKKKKKGGGGGGGGGRNTFITFIM